MVLIVLHVLFKNYFSSFLFFVHIFYFSIFEKFENVDVWAFYSPLVATIVLVAKNCVQRPILAFSVQVKKGINRHLLNAMYPFEHVFFLFERLLLLIVCFCLSFCIALEVKVLSFEILLFEMSESLIFGRSVALLWPPSS